MSRGAVVIWLAALDMAPVWRAFRTYKCYLARGRGKGTMGDAEGARLHWRCLCTGRRGDDRDQHFPTVVAILLAGDHRRLHHHDGG